MDLDPDLDPAVRAILDLVISGHLRWAEFSPAVRSWMYRPPIKLSPPIGLVRENLNLHQLDLAVVELEEP